MILAPLERAREFTDAPIKVLATAQASDTIALHDRRDLSTLDATVVAARRAYEMAGLTPAAIDLVEVHDCFTIAEICAIEDLGFCAKGEAGRLTEEGETALNGRIRSTPRAGSRPAATLSARPGSSRWPRSSSSSAATRGGGRSTAPRSE